MDALDIISLQSAKDNLSIDYSDYDSRIEALIKAAVNWVEIYTGWYLYQRDITIYSTSWQTIISNYPVVSFQVKNSSDVVLDPQPIAKQGSLSFSICCAPQSKISLTVGFAPDEVDTIPGPFIEACQKLIVYMFENKDMYGITLPTDIQILINQYRRSPTL